jgi:ribosome-associated toxin RatA of RatAB toxin-antitoxin module
MPKIHQILKADHGADKLYSIITDYDSYPEFLSWCKSAKVLGQKNKNTKKVDITISSGPVTKSFTTINQQKKDKMLHMQLEKGPFKKLDATWNISTIDDSHCEIEFDIDYEFSNILTRKLVDPVFAKLAAELTQAFIQRAKKLYS